MTNESEEPESPQLKLFTKRSLVLPIVVVLFATSMSLYEDFKKNGQISHFTIESSIFALVMSGLILFVMYRQGNTPEK